MSSKQKEKLVFLLPDRTYIRKRILLLFEKGERKATQGKWGLSWDEDYLRELHKLDYIILCKKATEFEITASGYRKLKIDLQKYIKTILDGDYAHFESEEDIHEYNSTKPLYFYDRSRKYIKATLDELSEILGTNKIPVTKSKFMDTKIKGELFFHPYEGSEYGYPYILETLIAMEYLGELKILVLGDQEDYIIEYAPQKITPDEPNENLYKYHGLTFDKKTGMTTFHKRKKHYAPSTSEYKFFKKLFEAQETLVSEQDMRSAIEKKYNKSPSAVQSLVRRIRKALKMPARSLRNVIKVWKGYQLIAPKKQLKK